MAFEMAAIGAGEEFRLHLRLPEPRLADERLNLPPVPGPWHCRPDRTTGERPHRPAVLMGLGLVVVDSRTRVLQLGLGSP